MLKDVELLSNKMGVYINGDWYADIAINKLSDEIEFEKDVDEMVKEWEEEWEGEAESVEFSILVRSEGTCYRIFTNRDGSVRYHRKIY